MNNKVVTAIFTAVGSGVGFALGILFTRKKFLQLADRESTSVKEHLEKEYKRQIDEKNKIIEKAKKEGFIFKNNVAEVKKVSKSNMNPKDFSTGNKLCGSTGIALSVQELDQKSYTDYTKPYSTGIKPENKPYILDSEEDAFALSDDVIGYTLYADHILADGDNCIIPEPEKEIGKENLDKLTEDNSYIYVHNPMTGKVYEIIYDDHTYREAVSGKTMDDEVYDEDD